MPVAGAVYFGTSVDVAGDVNGDGFSDLIVGADSGGAMNLGAASVFHGSASGVEPVAAITIEGVGPGDAEFASRVAGIGDVDADGFSDIAIGCTLHSTALETSLGRLAVHRGGRGGVSGMSARDLRGTANGEVFSQSIGGAADLNGDGFADLIVGSAYTREQPIGAVRVFAGGAGGTSAMPSTVIEGINMEGFGVAVAAASLKATSQVGEGRRLRLRSSS